MLPIGHAEHVTDASFSPDGKRIVTAAADAKIWDVESGMPLKTLSGNLNFPRDIKFSPDGLYMASCAGENEAIKNGEKVLARDKR